MPCESVLKIGPLRISDHAPVRYGVLVHFSFVASHEDVVLALLGAASAIGGLLLVFLGLLVSTIQGFTSGTSSNVLRPLKIAGFGVLLAFVSSALAIGLAVQWLTSRQSAVTYDWTVGLFVAQVAAAVLAAVWTYVVLIWKAG
jgi:hypothetical protein